MATAVKICGITRVEDALEAAGLYLMSVEYEGRWGLPDAPRRTLFPENE